MSELIGHFPCVANELDNKNSCSSSDALAIYIKQDEDENDYYDGYCWSCHQSFFKNEISESSLSGELGIDSDGGVKERKFTPKPKAEPLTSKEVTSLYKELGFPTKEYRNLKPEWMKYFGILIKYDNKGIANQVYYPEVEDKTVSGMKIRVIPKRFSKIGRTGLCSILGGQIKYKSPTKRLLIVAGENDGVASWGMLNDYYTSRGYGEMENVHVVWGTCGEGTLDKQLSKQYEFIDGYDEVIIGLDNDEAGDRALVKCLKILPSDKVKIAKWTLKDPHEMLERDRSGQFIRDFFNAKEFVNSGIKSAADAASEVKEFLTAKKITLPPYLNKLQENMRGGIKSTGAIVNIIGDTSIKCRSLHAGMCVE